MANKNYSGTKSAQAAGNTSYEGESGNSAQRDSTGSFGVKSQVNEMAGTGAPTSCQAKYSVPTDNWRSKSK